MPIMAINPLKRSAPVFIILKNSTLIVVFCAWERNTERTWIRVGIGRDELDEAKFEIDWDIFLYRFIAYQRFESVCFLGNRLEIVVVNNSKFALRWIISSTTSSKLEVLISWIFDNSLLSIGKYNINMPTIRSAFNFLSI